MRRLPSEGRRGGSPCGCHGRPRVDAARLRSSRLIWAMRARRARRELDATDSLRQSRARRRSRGSQPRGEVNVGVLDGVLQRRVPTRRRAFFLSFAGSRSRIITGATLEAARMRRAAARLRVVGLEEHAALAALQDLAALVRLARRRRVQPVGRPPSAAPAAARPRWCIAAVGPGPCTSAITVSRGARILFELRRRTSRRARGEARHLERAGSSYGCRVLKRPPPRTAAAPSGAGAPTRADDLVGGLLRLGLAAVAVGGAVAGAGRPVRRRGRAAGNTRRRSGGRKRRAGRWTVDPVLAS